MPPGALRTGGSVGAEPSGNKADIRSIADIVPSSLSGTSCTGVVLEAGSPGGAPSIRRRE